MTKTEQAWQKYVSFCDENDIPIMNHKAWLAMYNAAKEADEKKYRVKCTCRTLDESLTCTIKCKSFQS